MRIINAATNRALSEVFRLKSKNSANVKVVIIDARTTEGLNPVKTAYKAINAIVMSNRSRRNP